MTTASSSRFVAHPVAVVLLVWTGLFMTTLDASIVNIGLPAIARAFQTPLSGTIEWVIIGYLVVTATLLLTVGRLSDLVGRTPIWTAGLVLFTLASLVCGAAPALGLLIALGALAALVRGKEVRPPSGGGAVRYKPVASPWGILGRPQ